MKIILTVSGKIVILHFEIFFFPCKKLLQNDTNIGVSKSEIMKRIFVCFFIMLPLLVAAQNGISKKQSRYRLDALKRLEQTYSYLGGQHSGNLVVVGKDDLFGVVDFEGRTVIPLQYDWVAPALNGERFLLFSDTLIGIADRSGRMVVPMEYDAELYAEDEAVTFRYGLIVMSKGGKQGVLDTAGRTVVPMVYDEWLWLVDSNLMILHGYDLQIRQSYHTLMRLDGDTVIPTQRFINWWDGNLFRAQNDKNLWGLYDRSGRVVIACQYDYIDYLHNGLAAVKKGGRTGVIDIRGREVIPVAEDRFGGKTPYPQTRNLFVLEKDGRVGAVDSLGNTVIPFEYDFNPEGSASHLVFVRGDTAYFLFDNTGRLVCTYDNIDWYPECDASGPQLLFAVCRNGLWGLVDTAWREVVPCTYKGADFVDGRHWLMSLDEGTSCLIDEQGQVLFKGPYSFAYPLCDCIWRVGIYDRANNKNILGYVDAYGQTTLSRKELKEMERILTECAKKRNTPAVKTTVREADETIHTDTIPAGKTDSGEEEIDEVFVFVEENQPEFPGGDSALFMFICMNLSYPDQARDNGLEGMVWVRFVVKKDGTISNVKLLRDIGGGCGQAAVEMVKSMPRWKPATQSGKPVNCEFILPVNFQLTDDVPDGTREERCLFQYNNSNWK